MREDGDIPFAAAANQIIHHGHLMSCFAEMKRDMGTDEAAAAGHEYVQGSVLLSSPASMISPV